MVPGLTVTVNAVTPSVSIINILTALTVGLAFLGVRYLYLRLPPNIRD